MGAMRKPGQWENDPWGDPVLQGAEKIDVRIKRFSRVVITPILASYWLSINLGNRRVREALVKYLASQINGGEWCEDHPSPIVFSDQGRLIDGQHRLHAIVLAGIPVTARVEFGAKDETREYLDTGVSRKLEDRVTLMEDHIENLNVAQLVTAFFFKRSWSNKRPSPAEAREIFEEHRDSFTWMAKARRRVAKISQIWVCVAMCEFFEIDPDKAREFYEALHEPDGPIQPARMLRDFLRGSSSAGNRQQKTEVYTKTIAACKAYLAGRELKVLRAANW